MAAEANSNTSLDTFPKYLIENARVRGNRPAMREKDLGIWQVWTWSEMAEEILNLAAGLMELGVERGDKVAIVGDNRPRLYWTMVAVQAVGGVPVPTYQDSVADEMQYVLEHAEVKVAIVEDQEQVDKMLEVKDRCPKLETVVYDDDRGMRDYGGYDFIYNFVEVQAQGQAHRKKNVGDLKQAIADGHGEEIAIILYTSGTTGRPKGVMLSQNNLVKAGRESTTLEGLNDTEDTLAYLPMAWVGDHIFSIAQAYTAGYCVNIPEAPDTILTDLREIGPTYYFAPPRIFENLLTTITIRMEDASAMKRSMFHYFMEHAKRVGVDILDGKPVGMMDKLKYMVGDFLVYGPLKNTLGMSRVKLGYTAGEAIGPEIFAFYRSIGINLKQLYGQTESSVFITIQPNGEIRSDTVGRPFTDVEISVADSGEVMYRGPYTFVGYYKNDEATNETKTPEGWVHTGDAGFLDDEGHLRIIDRAKDVGKLNDGAMFAPKYVENKLKFFPIVKEVVAFGDQKENATAFVNIDLEAVGSWAERNGLAYSGYADLAGRKEVYDLIQDCVEKVNEDLSTDSHLSSSQIKRFLILHKELDADDGELTRTRKVRRKFIAERYGELIDALYSDKDQIHVDAEVTFEDGRKGRIQADLPIRDTKCFDVQPQLKKAS